MKSYMYMKSYIAVHAMSYLNIGILPIASGFLLSDLSLFSHAFFFESLSFLSEVDATDATDAVDTAGWVFAEPGKRYG